MGLHDLNTEFYVTDTSGLFFNSSFGVGRELSQTGLNGPSIFPVTSPAIRLRAETSKAFSLQIAVFDALSGNPQDPKGTHIRLNTNDGQLLIAESAYLRGKDDSKQLPAKYAMGTWAYTTTFDHQTATNDSGATPVRAPSHGAYFLADQAVTENLAMFLRYGLASTEVNRLGSNLSGGVVYTGLIPKRPKDRFGLAFTRVENGSEFKDKQQQLGVATKDAETTLEANYRIELIPGVALQPDLQYVIDPNTDPTLSNALVGAVRLELSF